MPGRSPGAKEIPVATGTVKFFNNDKGYGFIKAEGQEKDLFFHASELQEISFDELNEGDPVEFEISEGDKGPNATNITRA